MNDLAPILAVGFVVAFFVGAIFWNSSRSRDIIQGWADENGFEVLESEFCFFGGPFFFRSDGQTVYRVKVRNREGQVRMGWVRCGGWIGGLLSNQATVKWE